MVNNALPSFAVALADGPAVQKEDHQARTRRAKPAARLLANNPLDRNVAVRCRLVAGHRSLSSMTQWVIGT
jgi:hypothetical protein